MKFPRDKDQYILGAAIAMVNSFAVYRAKHVHSMTRKEVPVGIKIFNVYKIQDIYSLLSLTTYDDYHHPELPSDALDQTWTIPPEWMIDSQKGNDRVTDIWMLGLLALELLYGQIPAAFNLQEFRHML